MVDKIRAAEHVTRKDSKLVVTTRLVRTKSQSPPQYIYCSAQYLCTKHRLAKVNEPSKLAALFVDVHIGVMSSSFNLSIMQCVHCLHCFEIRPVSTQIGLLPGSQIVIFHPLLGGARARPADLSHDVLNGGGSVLFYVAEMNGRFGTQSAEGVPFVTV